MKALDKLLRAGDGKRLKALQALVPEINAFEEQMKGLSDEALKGKTAEFKERLANGEDLDDILTEAFAVVREASFRVIGQRHFDMQLMGGAALHFGWISEMKTGEGKTLVSTLPAYLNALTGQGVHVITVNDYLARFHAEWMGRIHNWLGLSVGLVIPGHKEMPEQRREAYAADITYGTNNEFGFDYLRDNMARTEGEKTQRGHAYAIVDEIDSILIDEARTPLIISGRVGDASSTYYKFASLARTLARGTDYEVEEDKKIVFPTESGVEKVEKQLGLDNLYDAVQQNLVHQLQVALRAKELYHRDKDYIIDGGEVKIVDEFTGRVLEGRRWSEGLHQAVEAKEGLRINQENQTLATITLQNYFRMYEKLSGMTGTAQTESAELMNTYGLHVVPIPTNKPTIRQDLSDVIYRTESSKLKAIVEDIASRCETGQPVLVGTISVAKSELLSSELKKRGIHHEVLNAKQHTREAAIVAQAGRLGSVTVATNMAGRGVDILLGGNPEMLARQQVISEGALASLFSEEADLPAPLAEMPEEYKAARAAAHARYKEILDDWKVQCSAEGDEVRKVGGLYVLGTERHDSRRIDNQLRGRSGRQGDPGESRFYLSLDDDLLRLFATGALNWVMGRALPEDEAIEAKPISKAIERAQTTVEQRNGEIRKNVLKYDEVLNEQRKVVYKLRDQVLSGSETEKSFPDHLATVVDGLIETHCAASYDDEWDLEGLTKEAASFWPVTESVISPSNATTDDLYDALMSDGLQHYTTRCESMGQDKIALLEKQVMLSVMDQRWLEHLEEMDYLKEGINLRSLGQKDPLSEWQQDGFEMFSKMVDGVSHDYVRYVMRAESPVESPAPVIVVADTDNGAAGSSGTLKTAKIPRNAQCPCGSGKKHKLCHGVKA